MEEPELKEAAETEGTPEEPISGISKQEKIRYLIFIGVMTVVTIACVILALTLPGYIREKADTDTTVVEVTETVTQVN